MDYEKKYKEALERMKLWVRGEHPECFTEAQKAAEFIFPELKENGDEKIKKDVKRAISVALDYSYFDKETANNCLAWLEKQGEQKSKNETTDTCDSLIIKSKEFPAGEKRDFDYFSESADKIEPKFHEGDWISGYYTNYRVTAINSEGYVVEDTDGNKINILFENEKFHHLFTIADAKNGDVLVTEEDGKPFIFRDCPDTNNPNALVAYCGIDCANRLTISTDAQWWTDEKVCPATKGQRDTLERAIANAGYRWDEKKKELKKLTQQEVTKISDQEKYFIEIPFGAYDSELIEDTYFIPEGCHAVIVGNEVVIKKGERKPAWSKEDEHRAEDTIYFLDTAKKHYASTVELDACIDWLKSFKDRVGCEVNCTTTKEWSEEDEKMLENCINALGDSSFDTYEIEEWVKSLKQRIGG